MRANRISMLRKAVPAAFLIAALLCAACGAGGQQTETSASLVNEEELALDYTNVSGAPVAPGMRIAMVVKDTGNPFWDTIREGADHAIEAVNEANAFEGEDAVSLIYEGVREEDDVDAQINVIDMIVAENPDAICISAIDASSCEPQLIAAQDNGIPVIMMDSGVESDLFAAYCGTDNVAAGGHAAEHLAQAIGEEGDVLVVSHTEQSQTAIDRTEGIEEVLKTHKSIRIMKTVADQSEMPAADQIREAMDENPDLRGIVCTSGPASEAALEICAERGASGVAVVGFDSGTAQIEAVQEGREVGFITQDPRGIGYSAIAASLYAAAGREIDREIETAFIWVDQKNIDAQEVRAYLYE